MPNGITHVYLPPTRFIPVSAEQYLEHYIHKELLHVAVHLTDLEKMEAWVEMSVQGFESQISLTLRELTHSRNSWRFNELS